jgi:hypothetical protein
MLVVNVMVHILHLVGGLLLLNSIYVCYNLIRNVTVNYMLNFQLVWIVVAFLTLLRIVLLTSSGLSSQRRV